MKILYHDVKSKWDLKNSVVGQVFEKNNDDSFQVLFTKLC